MSKDDSKLEVDGHPYDLFSQACVEHLRGQLAARDAALVDARALVRRAYWNDAGDESLYDDLDAYLAAHPKKGEPNGD